MAAGEVGVIGRRRERDTLTADETTTTVKRRKMVESRMSLSGTTSVVIVRRPVEEEEECEILRSEFDDSVSCWSRSEEKSKRRIEFEEDDNGIDQTETSWIYDNFNNSEESVNEMDSEIQEDAVESRRRLRMEKKKNKRSETVKVKESEIEDFFQEAEKDLRNKMLECSHKYNFDFEKDEPLGGGRYEWVKLD